MFPVSIGDYNIYLSTIPQPSDYKIVMDELDRTQAAYKMKIRRLGNSRQINIIITDTHWEHIQLLIFK